MRIFNLILIILFAGDCTAQVQPKELVKNNDDNTLLWQISGNGLKQPSYLFGTFHLLCKEDVHFSDQLKAAVQNSNEIYMELNMGDPEIAQEALKLVYMNGGKKLKDLYTDSEYKRVNNYFNDSLQMPLAYVDKMKPYFLMALLYPKMLPCTTTSGIEEQLMQLAKEDKKQIKGLETIEFQASVFDSIPYKEQAKELLQSIDSIGAYRVEFDSMLTIYKSQTINKIEGLFDKSEFGMEGHEDILLDNRNKDWVGKLKKNMADESVFVAVGAGHLVGKNGLIELLRKQGYVVIPLLNK
jgi:uncharacterized protein YbaP (TraB family)